MADVSARYALPFLQAGQAQKEITHNVAVDRIDALLQLAVASRTVTTPPEMPAAGMSWIVPDACNGAWSSRGGQIATASDGGWIFVVPRDGCVAWVAEESVFAVFFEGVWHGDAWPAAGLRIAGHPILTTTAAAIATPSGGATIDSEARVTLSAVLDAMRLLGLIAS